MYYYLYVKPHTRATIQLDIICGPNESTENIAACAREMLGEVKAWDTDNVPFTRDGVHVYNTMLSLVKDMPDLAFMDDIEFNPGKLNNILIRTNVIKNDHLGNRISRISRSSGTLPICVLGEEDRIKLKWVRLRNFLPFTNKYSFTSPSMCYIRDASLYYNYLDTRHCGYRQRRTGSSSKASKSTDNAHYDTSTTVIHSHDISMF